jgi:hypothetical protein
MPQDLVRDRVVAFANRHLKGQTSSSKRPAMPWPAGSARRRQRSNVRPAIRRRGRERQSPSISPTNTTPAAIPTSSQIPPMMLLGAKTASPRYTATAQITPLPMSKLLIFPPASSVRSPCQNSPLGPGLLCVLYPASVMRNLEHYAGMRHHSHVRILKGSYVRT